MKLLKLPVPVGLILLALASCARVIPPPAAPPPPVEAPPPLPQPAPPPAPVPPPPENALAAGVRFGPSVERLDLSGEAQRAALEAFLISCPSLLTRQDPSGLAAPGDWREACDAGRDWPRSEPGRFFDRHFETVIVGDGAAFATGYYEPEIRGCRTRRPGCEVPVYRVPPDLLETNPLTGASGRGHIDENGNYVLYHDRAAIEDGALAGRGLELAWAADPIDLFFLQIQGSGRLSLPDGGVMRIGYAGQNGREYVAIGRLLRERGIMTTGISMQRIVDWLRANPAEGRALMRENLSYIFFRELTGPGPLGALGRPVTPRVSVAADPRFVPLGAPVLLSEMDNARANGLWVAQDTGGAIRGANRFDTFWGAGQDAAATAGGMQARGRALIFLPRPAAARLRTRLAPSQP
ncbi:MAG: murein transglycosylase A [Sphingosinicella sp.]|uniref:murein transglycosylase A n=1 Tax=Sphingosinicella sp. TaxID=1917971 RepID=UPI004037BDF5